MNDDDVSLAYKCVMYDDAKLFRPKTLPTKSRTATPLRRVLVRCVHSSSKTEDPGEDLENMVTERVNSVRGRQRVTPSMARHDRIYHGVGEGHGLLIRGIPFPISDSAPSLRSNSNH